MNLNPIWHSFPAKKIKCSFLDYVQLLMISLASQWTQNPSATPLQSKKWNAYFWITFNFWWLAELVEGLKPHPPPVSSQKNEMFIFGLRSLLMISWAGWWSRTPSANPLQPKKMKCSFLVLFNFWWSARLLNGLKPHLPPLSRQKMKCYFLDYIQLLMIGWDGWGTQTPSTTPLHPKKWNDHFWITFNFWWSARLVNGLEPHPPLLSSQKKIKCSFSDYVHFWWSAWLIDELEPHLPPLSYQKNEMLNFQLHSTSDDQPSWSMDSKSICQPSPANKMKCSLLDYVHFRWSARLVDGLKPHPSPISSQ